MEREYTSKEPKISVKIKRTPKGIWYLNSLKVNGNTVDEIDALIDSASSKINEKLKRLNAETTEDVKIKVEKHISLNPSEKAVFEELRQLRTKISMRENIPPYMVFHDSVLKLMAVQKPQTREEMLKIKGMGEIKFEKYGNEFLNMISKFRSLTKISDKSYDL